jgi:uncharacterized Tic20 family protein
MFHAPLTPQARRRSAICHWGGLLWLPMTIAIFMIFPELNQDMASAFFALFLAPCGSLILAGIIQMLLWKGWRTKHEFIDRCGREASNFGLSAALYLTVMEMICLATCGLSGLLSIPLYVGMIGIYLLPAFLLLHFLMSVVGGFVAWRGNYYVYPWTIRFFR